MQISFKGFRNIVVSLLKLIIVGLIVVISFKILKSLLPFLIVGAVMVYLIGYYQNQKRNKEEEKEVVLTK